MTLQAQAIYGQLAKLGVIHLITAEPEIDGAKSKAAGFMDLHFDRLYSEGDTVTIALAHYFKQNGDLCSDPDMEIVVDLQTKTANANHFQQAIPPMFQSIHDASPAQRKGLQGSLNDFLSSWVKNLIQQGHGQDWNTGDEPELNTTPATQGPGF